MGYYTFACNECGEFNEWHKSLLGQKSYATCPTCKQIATRIFKAPLTSKMDGRLKKRIENGMEPRVISKEAMPTNSKKTVTTPARPWQVGH